LIQQDILFLKHFTDDTQIGLFSAGYRIIIAIIAFITPVFVVMLPEFSRKAAQSLSDVSDFGGKVAQLFLAAIIPGAVLLTLIAKPLLVFLYGPPFAAAAPVLHFLSAVIFLRSLEFLFDMGLVSVNKPWWVFIAASTSLVVNVGLNILWIPKWGFMGAVYAKLVAEIVIFSLAVGLFQLAVRGSLFPKWTLHPIVAGAAFLVAMYLSQGLGSTAAFLIGLCVYIIIFSILAKSLLRSLITLGIKS
jgi:O-antigen/teichoic acid export membrane protein